MNGGAGVDLIHFDVINQNELQISKTADQHVHIQYANPAAPGHNAAVLTLSGVENIQFGDGPVLSLIGIAVQEAA